jgi:predicted nucleic acid-binding protein
MPERFLDTNVVLRHLLNDHPDHSPRARSLIRAIEDGRETAWTTDLAIAEVVFVLDSPRFFGTPRATIRDLLLPLIELPGIKLPNKRLYRRVFELYTTRSIDFIDCYHAALAESRRRTEVWSFDRDFDRVPGITRIEP